MSEKDYKKRRNRRRFKLEKFKKDVVYTGESKRRKLALENIFDNFKEVFDTSYSEIKHCKLEKCKIGTGVGEKVIRGIDSTTRIDRKNRMTSRGCGGKKVIRESTSEWKNFIRLLRSQTTR